MADASPAKNTEVPLLTEPVDGVPDPLTSAPALRAAIDGLVKGSGPVAVDAERASGYRYSQRAYLVQIRRAGYGTVLIDPIALPDLKELGAALADVEWVLHAANQDLPCLADLGMVPSRIFDTELAGRLLGDERVALGTMVERHLGVRLEKGFSAADWSSRPLPQDWLVYAALDVELLVSLREELGAELAAAGKSDWAEQEFAAELSRPAPPPREEPWRRTSGIHSVRHRRQLAMVRALWHARDELAALRDIAPGRLLPDSAIVAAARVQPRRASDLAQLPIFGGPRQRRYLRRWFAAIESARALPESELPSHTGRGDPVPAASRFRDRDPDAADRLANVRDVIGELAEEHHVLRQNLLAADVLRRLAWQPPQPASEESVGAALADLGARTWQIQLTAGRLAQALGAR